MTDQIETVDTEGLRSKSKLGIWIAAWLGVLTLIEYLIAINVDNPLLLLLPFVVAKGWLIMRYFMHFQDVFGGEH
jgi:cytochrome c oxidase subunit IV